MENINFRITRKATVYSKKKGAHQKNIVLLKDTGTLDFAKEQAEKMIGKKLLFNKTGKDYTASFRGFLAPESVTIFISNNKN